MWRRTLHAIWAVALLAGCGDGTGPEVLLLDVRVHLLESEFGPLDANLTNVEIDALFDEVNAIWQQADIQWAVTEIVRERALNEATYEAILDGVLPASAEALSSVLPSDQLTRGRWDVFFVRTLRTIAGGVYLPLVPAVVVGEFGPLGERDFAVTGPRILAHELGHSLGLAHVPCTADGNLMAVGCTLGTRTRLAQDQIVRTRQQASANRPAGPF